MENPTALFLVGGSVTVKNDSVACSDRCIKLNGDASVVDGFDFAQKDASLCRAQSWNQHLVIAAAEPAWREASRK